LIRLQNLAQNKGHDRRDPTGEGCGDGGHGPMPRDPPQRSGKYDGKGEGRGDRKKSEIPRHRRGNNEGNDGQGKAGPKEHNRNETEEDERRSQIVLENDEHPRDDDQGPRL